MNAETKAEIHACARASQEGGISFADVVRRLMAAGVERYLVDFTRGDSTYYMPDGAVEIVTGHKTATAPATIFSAVDMAAAVRNAQAGLPYRAFCEQALAAGCVGYITSMAGKRVVYYGRTGDVHVEYFPGSRT